MIVEEYSSGLLFHIPVISTAVNRWRVASAYVYIHFRKGFAF